MPRQLSDTRKCVLAASIGGEAILFVILRQLSQRTSDPFGQPGMTPQPLRGAIAQDARKSPPAERDACIGQGKLHRAEPAFEGVIADAQVEITNARLVQG